MKRAGYLVAGLGEAGDAALELLARSDDAHPVIGWESGNSPNADKWRSRGVFVSDSADGSDALDRAGADAVVIKSPGLPPDLPLLNTAKSRGLEIIDELELAWRETDRPVVGVTGTNGKSTTCSLIATAIGDGSWVGNTELGMPLSAAKGDGWIVCEVSSFQLEFAPSFQPQVAVFTNLTRDHLTHHSSFEEYFEIKSRMFVADAGVCGHAVINIDDPHGQGLDGDVLAAGGRATTFGFGPADIQVVSAIFDARQAQITLDVKGEVVECQTRLPGRHNALNLAGAVGAALATGMELGDVVGNLAGAAPPPGRAEVIDAGQPFDVIVDYAHNGDGIEQVLSTYAEVAHEREGELRTVFGPVSGVDPGKAAESAAAVARNSDHIRVTRGSMGQGDPRARIAEMHAALDRADATIVLDRAEAIELTIQDACAGDIVAILGHGTLGRLLDGAPDARIPHDDRDAARAALSRLALS